MRVFEREIYILDIRTVDLDECQRIIAEIPIEGLILKFTDDRQIDIGALCYQKRNEKPRALVKKVDFASFRPERRKSIRAWVRHKITLFYTSKSAYTVSQNASELNGLLNWADGNGFENILLSPEDYHNSVQAYSQDLNRQVGQNKNKFTASRLQVEALRSGPIFFPKTKINFLDDMPIISVDYGERKPTEPPLKKEIEEYLTPCQYIFDGLTEFLLKFDKFPYQIPFMTEHLWLLPGRHAFISEELHTLTSRARNNIRWDYRNGRIRTLEEAAMLTSMPEDKLRCKLDEANKVLTEANTDKRHEKRMRLAKLAHDAFIPLFVANSGMNEQQVRDLPFTKNYTTFAVEAKGFVGIKLRAGGREVKFSIRKKFTKQFDKFIRLRSFICEHNSSDYLFLGISYYDAKIVGQLRAAEIEHLNSIIRNNLILKFKGLRYQKLRKYKSNYLLSTGQPIQIVASLMQTNENTILRSYAQGNEMKAVSEITSMINQLVRLLDDYSGEDIPVGDCANPDGRSDAVTPPPDYEPNCKNFEGCIFCSQFRTHADERSIRKLLSLRFVTLEYLKSCVDKDHFDKVHGAAIAQVDRIIARLLEERPELSTVADRISAEISDKFNLSDYWKRFYHRMIKMRIM